MPESVCLETPICNASAKCIRIEFECLVMTDWSTLCYLIVYYVFEINILYFSIMYINNEIRIFVSDFATIPFALPSKGPYTLFSHKSNVCYVICFPCSNVIPTYHMFLLPQFNYLRGTNLGSYCITLSLNLSRVAN